MRVTRWIQTVVVGALATLASVCLAAPVTGPEFPPPGGVTYSGSGNVNSAAGFQFAFSDFDSTQYNALWWGANGLFPVGIDLNDGDFADSGELLGSGSLLSANTIVYSGSSLLWYASGSGYSSTTLPTRLLISAVDGSSNAMTPIATSAISGLSDGRDYVFAVPGSDFGGDFTVSFQAQAEYRDVWTPLNQTFSGFLGLFVAEGVERKGVTERRGTETTAICSH